MAGAARIRTMKPSFWASPEAAAMSRDARLLTLGLIQHADDDGRFLATPARILGDVYPNDDIRPAALGRWLDEIEATGMLHRYTADGLRYGCFPSWHKHQVINRYTASTLPEPDVTCHPRGGAK